MAALFRVVPRLDSSSVVLPVPELLYSKTVCPPPVRLSGPLPPSPYPVAASVQALSFHTCVALCSFLACVSIAL